MTTIHTDDVSATTPSAPRPASHAAPARSDRRQVNVLASLGHVALAVWALLVIAPLIWTFMAAFKTNPENIGDAWTLPSHFNFAAFGRAWSRTHIATHTFNSVVIDTFSTSGTMMFGPMAAYVLTRYQFWAN